MATAVAQTLPESDAPAAFTLPSDADASGRDLGEEELAFLRAVITSGTLNCT